VRTRKYDAIGYNWLVSGETGEIFEGRGWKIGAATKGWNSKTISISYIGDSDKGLTAIGKESILTVVGAIRKKYGDHLWLKCHKDFSTTTCPGKNLTEWIYSGANVADSPSNVAIDWGAIQRYIIDKGNAYLNTRVLKRGSKGELVSLAQNRLNDLVKADLKVDGIYGRKTGDAVKKFKSNYAMKVNKIIDKNTWKVLWTV
tara:strand:- start:2411 stop:3013 length:603 start_codon:yes stop_codon:yes gene_type:complete